MTIPLMLCTLIALTSGVHFGKEFAAQHRAQGNMLIPVLAHMALSATLMVISVLLDQTPANLLWMVVATASLGGLALGALLPARAALAQQPAAPAQAAQTAQTEHLNAA